MDGRDKRPSRYATRLRCVGAAHSRHRTTEVRGAPGGLAARKTRTIPVPRQRRECQQLCRAHLQGPLAGEREALESEGASVALEVSKSLIDHVASMTDASRSLRTCSKSIL